MVEEALSMHLLGIRRMRKKCTFLILGMLKIFPTNRSILHNLYKFKDIEKSTFVRCCKSSGPNYL
jgi:hypothetical protein